MGFTWDPAKAEANRRKHGIDFADAVGVFEDALALTRPDPHPSEARFATVGRDFVDRLVVVAWTWDADDIRLIMARRATPRERRDSAEGADA
ncbi:MAG: BrnT family toxin [Gemmatimonadaceae bacterium]